MAVLAAAASSVKMAQPVSQKIDYTGFNKVLDNTIGTFRELSWPSCGMHMLMPHTDTASH